MAAPAQLQKAFTCFNCKKEIKLQRKDDNSGWLRFETDGATKHECGDKKQQPKQQSQGTSPPSIQSRPDSNTAEVIVLLQKAIQLLLEERARDQKK